MPALHYTECMRAFAWISLALWLALTLFGSSPIAAQPPQKVPGVPVVLVMESGAGVQAALELRAVLNRQMDVTVLSLEEAASAQVQPAALLTVAADRAHRVRVVFWDLAGGSDSLSAPAPANVQEANAVVLALSSALLDRHRHDLLENTIRSGFAVNLESLAWANYALLGRMRQLVPRTNVKLRAEDF
jgi:hypothetical protein